MVPNLATLDCAYGEALAYVVWMLSVEDTSMILHNKKLRKLYFEVLLVLGIITENS